MYIYVHYGMFWPVRICIFCTYIRTWIRTLRRTDSLIPEAKIFISADDLGRESWDRCSQSQRLDWNLDCGFYPKDTVTSKQKREVTLPKPNLSRCRRRKGPGRRPASSLWLSRTSALERTSFVLFLQRRKKVVVLYKQWCMYLVRIFIHICTDMES